MMPSAMSPFSQQDPGFTPFKVRILLVDDQAIVAEAVRRLISDQVDIEFHFVSEAQAALETAIHLKPTVILQDLVMPAFDGFELVRQYRANAATKDIPIIVLSAKEDPKLKAQAFSTGANDYIVKLPDSLELVARIRYHSAAYLNRIQRDDAFRFLRESQQKLAEANIELQKLAALDGLTGIANRRRFDEVLKSEWQRGQREKRPLSLLMCDIDQFKTYNDSHGHLAGDLCLKKVAAVLNSTLKRPADLAARYGGEEFALILPDTEREGALQIAEKCRQGIEALAIANAGSSAAHLITISIGVCCIVPSKDMMAEDLIDMADRGLYDAKQQGRNRVVVRG